MKYILLLFTLTTFGQTQKFIPLDDDTLEFISEVSYTLYSNKIPIFAGITSKDSLTTFPKNIDFDSISFTKLNFKETGLKKEYLNEVVRLKKIGFELDEVIISNTKQNQIEIGEKTRFVKRYSNSISKDMVYGLLFRESDLKNKQINRLHFNVEKVKYKTTYKIKFYAAYEIANVDNVHTLELNEVLFESSILTLEKGTKNEIEVNFEEYEINVANQDVFVCLELNAYYDENNNIVKPNLKEQTKLKFQLSNHTDYYAKTSNFYTKNLNNEMININAMINRDFNYMFFKKPHKSDLVAPAIILYCTKMKF